ncbi:MAG: hypothetical protein E6929_03925 [Clostridium sp.]|nr:hypothetical protein [Clostridium sp.]
MIFNFLNNIFKKAADILSSIPSFVWMTLGFILLILTLTYILQMLAMIKKFRNAKTVDLINEAEDNLLEKINLIDKFIGPSNKNRKEKSNERVIK